MPTYATTASYKTNVNQTIVCSTDAVLMYENRNRVSNILIASESFVVKNLHTFVSEAWIWLIWESS
jgi:hypothetical protein